MNSPIKFKFYDKKRKWLMDVIFIDWEKGIVACFYGGQVWISLYEHGELLQYTGRKDKTGKEVYNGHIVFADDPLGGITLEVFWDGAVSGFACRLGIYTCPLPEPKNMEIIGNRFENPELLQVEKGD